MAARAVRIPWALVGVLALAAGHYALQSAFTMDDAATTFACARHFAEGRGLGVLTPGAFRVESYSNLLWLLLLAAGHKLGLSELVAAKVLGFLFALGTTGLLYALLQRTVRHAWALWGVALLPLSMVFAYWSASGLENSLCGFLILAACWALLHEDATPQRLPWRSAVLFGLVMLTRPDGLIYAVAGGAFKAHRRFWNRSETWAALVRWGGLVALELGALTLWRLWYFAWPWPNTVYAKSATPGLFAVLSHVLDPRSPGWSYVARYAWSDGALALLPGLMAAALLVWWDEWIVFVIMALTSLLLPLHAPDWMAHFRFLYVFALFATGLAVLAVDRLWMRSRALAGLMLAGMAIYAALNVRVSLAEFQQTTHLSTLSDIEGLYAPLKDALDDMGVEDPLVVGPDLGATSYLLNLRILDSAGLADVQVARNNALPFLQEYLVRERRPDVVRTYAQAPELFEMLHREGYFPIKVRPEALDFVRDEHLLAPSSDSAPLLETSDGLAVMRVEAPEGLAPGKALPVVVDWRQTRRGAHLQFQVILRNERGRVVAESTPTVGYDWLPPDVWPEGAIVRQRLLVPITVPPGNYMLDVGFVDAARGIRQTMPVLKSLVLSDEGGTAAARHALDKAWTLGLAGNAGAVQRQLSLARAVAPAAMDLDGALAQVSGDWEAQYLGRAQAAVQAGQWTQAAEFAATAGRLRGRHVSSAAWIAFGAEAKARAQEAAHQGDWDRAYALARVAAESNHNDTWAMRRWEEARERRVARGR